MSILYIWDADYPWDVRVEKICKSITNAGHEVHIASRNLKGNCRYEESEGFHIHRLPVWKNKRLNYFISFPAFFNPFWTIFLKKIIMRYKIKIIIVRDLPLAIAGIWAGKNHGIPVILDMAEDYVAMIWDIWRARKYQGLNLIIRNPYLARLVEKYAVKNIDHIFLVAEEANSIINRNRGELKNTTIVSNTPSIKKFENSKIINNKKIKFMKNRYSVIYTGGIQMGRGIQNVIDAIPSLIKKIPEFLFVIVGTGYAVDRLKEKIKDLNIEKYVLWTGWVEHTEMYAYIKAAKAGLIPHIVTEHINTTMPNKIYDYMGFGLPIIATDAKPLKRIIKNEKCGINYKSGDVEDLIRAILYIYNSNGNIGLSGRMAIETKYNWDCDEKRMIAALNRILSKSY